MAMDIDLTLLLKEIEHALPSIADGLSGWNVRPVAARQIKGTFDIIFEGQLAGRKRYFGYSIEPIPTRIRPVENLEADLAGEIIWAHLAGDYPLLRDPIDASSIDWRSIRPHSLPDTIDAALTESEPEAFCFDSNLTTS